LTSSNIIVVGGGIFGTSVARELKKRGHSVTLFDSGPLPNPDASSSDISKVIRADYGADRFYAELATKAITGWNQWNRESGQTLYEETGNLWLTPQPMTKGQFEFESCRVLSELDCPIEPLGKSEIQERFPAWKEAGYSHGYYNPRGGWAKSTSTVAWLLEKATEEGVILRQNNGMTELLEHSNQVEGIITQDGAEHRSDLVIIATGAWTPRLLPWMNKILRSVAQPVYHFQVADPSAYQGKRFPQWGANVSETGWYGFPAQEEGILKVAHHGRGIPMNFGDNQSVFPEMDKKFRNFLSSAFPELQDAPIVKRRLCFYCDSLDGDFWIDHDAERKNLVVATGGSGHGFKFGPVLGEIIADVAEQKSNPWAYRFQRRSVSKPPTDAARSND
jgi:glycine/D-amino acid oxidase-like deaminating enzyme